MGDGLGITQKVVEGREGRKTVADTGGRQAQAFQLITPFRDMASGYLTALLGGGDASEQHKLPEVVAIGALGVGVFLIGRPLVFRSHDGQVPKFLGSDGLGFEGCEVGGGHGFSISYCPSENKDSDNTWAGSFLRRADRFRAQLPGSVR